MTICRSPRACAELAENKNAKLRKRHKVAIESLPVVHHRGGGYEDTDIPDTLASDVGAPRRSKSGVGASRDSRSRPKPRSAR